MKTNGLLAVLVPVLLLLCAALAPSAPPDKAPPPWKLAEARADAAERACNLLAADYVQGRATLDQARQWSQNAMNARRDLTTKRGEQLAAQEAHVRRMQDLEKAARDKVEAKRAAPAEAAIAEYYRLGAEIDWSKAKASK